jgi:hypothetical protein
MNLAVPSFGELVFDAPMLGRARALISRNEHIARRRRVQGDAVRADVAAPDDGSNSGSIPVRTNRNSILGFLAVSGNPFQRVPCVGRPVTPAGAAQVTPVTQAP